MSFKEFVTSSQPMPAATPVSNASTVDALKQIKKLPPPPGQQDFQRKIQQAILMAQQGKVKTPAQAADAVVTQDIFARNPE